MQGGRLALEILESILHSLCVQCTLTSSMNSTNMSTPTVGIMDDEWCRRPIVIDPCMDKKRPRFGVTNIGCKDGVCLHVHRCGSIRSASWIEVVRDREIVVILQNTWSYSSLDRWLVSEDRERWRPPETIIQVPGIISMATKISWPAPTLG